MSYATFSKFYDRVMGDREPTARYIRSLVRKHNPRAKTLLELACGTGSLLALLRRQFAVSGLDLSPEMLAIAKEKVPDVPLVEASMTSFDLGRTFDVVLCAFDSINHLTDFSQWTSTFDSAARHLEPGGIFVFDMNTEWKLDWLCDEPTWVEDLPPDVVLFNVRRVGKGLVHWDIRAFEHDGGSRFTCHEDSIDERAFPYDKVHSALARRFSSVHSTDPDRARRSQQSERLYFVCKK